MKNIFLTIPSKRLFVILFLLCLNSSFAQTVYYANSATGNDANAGTIGAPFKTFHKAYTSATSGDIINLTGTFTWTATDEIGDLSTTGYSISKNISIEGNNASTTIIQAANADNISDRRVFTFIFGYTVNINNCTIRYGKSSDGGGIQVDGSSTINNCDVSYNRASGSGGGVNCRGNVHITNSLISNNFAFYMGGGVNRDYYSGNDGTPGSSNTLIITNSTIAYNQVLATYAYIEGGGVFFRRGIGTITNSIIAYNKVTNADSSTNGLGTGDPSAVVNLKNNIIANNFRYNCWSGDIGHRESSNSGTYVDNGYNIFGVKGYYSQGLTVSSTSWLDHISNCSTPDGVFILQNGQNCRSGQLYLATVLAENSTLNNIKNFEILDQTSIAINNGSNTSNLSTSIPNLDMRGFSRVGNVDIGSIEYQSVVASFEAPVAGNISSSQLVCYNSSASDITLSGYTGSIQWQTSLNNSTWTNISGATNSILTSTQIGTLTQTKYFRANVSNGGCTVTSNPTVSVTVNSLPSRPVTVTTINYCQGDTATALTATATTGHTLQWYSVATGGTASLTAPTPITSSVGTTTYYVSQLNNSTNCESERGAITVTVYSLPLAPTAPTTINYCQGATATALTATATTGHALQWYTVSTGGTTSNTAPTPLTTTIGTTTYYVSQKNNTTNCEGPRTAITVNVNSVPTISGVQNMTVGGSTLQLTGSGTPNATTPWVSSNTAIATISSTGVVTAISGGSTTITYTTSEGCSVSGIINILNCEAPFGNAMSFDGTNDYVTVGDSFENLADVTTEAWVYWRGSTNAFSEIFTKDLVSAFAITSTNKLHANFGNGSGWDIGLNSTASIPLNTWTHLAVTRQNGLVRMYINGQQDSATATMSATGQNSSHRALGAKLLGTSLYPNSTINGSIDEVRFWSTARTQAQIQASMNTQLVGNESGLLAYYTFNHGIAGGNNTSVTTIVNLVNSATNGTITNSDKIGTNSNLVVGVTSDFTISGAAIVCSNTTSQYTHPIAGGTWSLSSGATATISSTGVLTTTVSEILTISYTYTINGCSYTDTKSVTIQSPVVSGSNTIGIGDQITYTATTTPANLNAWVSSNTSVATISNLGVATGLTLGTTNITFTNSNGCTATQTITVVTGVTQIPVLTSPAANTTGATTLNINYSLPETPLAGSVRLTFTPTAGGTPIVWTMTNAASVSFSHVVGTDPLAVNPNNVVVGGTLSFATYNLTLSYQDANGNPVAQVTNANIQTLAPPGISFASSTQTAVVNRAISITTNNSGGAATFTITPALPVGVALNSSTGLISGTPTAIMSSRLYTVTATNAAGSGSATFTLFIDSDLDNDGIGDTTDPDIDGDGVPNTVEIQEGTSPTNPNDKKDTDRDGVPDYVELQQGTNPTNPNDARDTDGDGVPDYVEIQQGTNTTNPGDVKDTDGDGVPDYVEVQQGTNPTNPGDVKDTDGDGIADYIEVQQGTNPNAPGDQLIDTDGDGVPDYIEILQGTNPNAPGDQLIDTDGDGVPDYVEVQQGTNPNNPNDARDRDGDGVPDYVEIQQGTNPTNPGDVKDTDGDGIADYIEVQQGTNPNAPGDQLIDTDGDGVPDYIEILQGTNPNAPGDQLIDTDGDGVPDFVEVQQGTSPNLPGDTVDTDGDGIPNYVEIQQGTNPNTPGDQVIDTDGDGVPDYVEVQQGTNPNLPGDGRDTDGDGIPDYVENLQGTNPNTPGDSLIDTDGDGVPDYVEVQQGSDPNNPNDSIDTDGDGVPDYVEVQQGTNPNAPSDARDTDGDGTPDFIEQQEGTNPNNPFDFKDDDGDGISNYEEGYNFQNPNQSIDTDGDGIADYRDSDSDGDTILDVNDAFPLDKNEWKDTDGDGRGDNADTDDDNDGILDVCDVDVNGDGIPDNGVDMDGDGIIDSCDPDRDGDGVNNTSDNCPDTPNRDQADRDRDGLGNVCDTIELNVMEGLTPNGDGINDTWVIYNIENHPGSIVRVYNTNGKQVFYSANYKNDWNGNYQGSSEMLPVGSYMFQIDLDGDGTIDSQGWMYISK